MDAGQGSGHANQEVTLKVTEQLDCPLFRKGDKMVIRLPEIDTGSGKICVYAASQALPLISQAVRDDQEVAVHMPEFRCLSGGEHYAQFEVESHLVVEGVESAAARSLRKVPFLEGLSRLDMEKVVAKLQTDQYFPRSLLVEAGQEVDRLVLITKGIAEIVSIEDGMERIGGRVTEGEVYGYGDLSRRAPAAASLRCLTIVQASLLRRQDLEELAGQDPHLGEHLQQHGF